MRFLKKIAPIAATALMMGATLGFAAAADLSTWTTDFDGADIVVHAGLATNHNDVMAAMDIGNALGIQTTVIPAGPEIGESTWIKAAGDVLGYGDDLDEMAAAGIDDDEMPTILADGTFDENEGDNSNTVDYDQTIEFDPDAAATLTLALDIDEDSDNEAAGTYLFFDKGDNIYTYTLQFDEDVDYEDGDEAADLEDAEIEILGRNYLITDVTADAGGIQTLTLMSGTVLDTLALEESATYTVDGETYDVEPIFIDADECKLEVNGETTAALQEGETDEVAGIEVGVREVLYQDFAGGIMQCEFYLGAQSIELDEDGGEVRINDELIPDYDTTVNFDNDADSIANIEISVAPDDDMWRGLGESWTDPIFGTWKLDFKEFVADTEMIELDVTSGDEGTLTFTNNAGDEIAIPLVLDDGNDDVAWGSDSTWINNNGVADADGEGVDAGTDEIGMAFEDGQVCQVAEGVEANEDDELEDDCDDFPFVVISAAGEARLYSVTDMDVAADTVDIVDEQTGEVIVNDGDASVPIAIPGMGDITLDFIDNDGGGTIDAIEFTDIDLAGDGNMDTSLGGYLDLEVGTDNAGDADLIVGDGAANEDTHTIEDDGADDMTITFDGGLDFMDIEEDSDTEIALDAADWGIIYTNKDSTDDNDVTIEYPEEVDDDTGVSAKIYATEILAEEAEEAAGVVEGIAYDSTDPAEFTGPVIAVGGTAINRIAATLLGCDYPTYGTESCWQDATGVTGDGMGIIKIIESPAVGSIAMLVAGWEGPETKVLGEILKEGTPALTGTEALIDTAGRTVITV